MMWMFLENHHAQTLVAIFEFLFWEYKDEKRSNWKMSLEKVFQNVQWKLMTTVKPDDNHLQRTPPTPSTSRSEECYEEKKYQLATKKKDTYIMEVGT